MKHKQAVAIVKKDITTLGHTAVAQVNASTNGPDIEVWTGKKGYRVEVKVAVKLKNGGWQIGPLAEKNTDMLAIVMPNKRIVYSSMKDHKKIMGERGYRGVSDYINFFNT